MGTSLWLRARREWSRSREGAALAAVLVSTLVVGIVGMALVNRTIRSSRTARWSRDHLVLRMLAESAAEELYLSAQESSNLPGDPVFQAFRAPLAGPSASPAPLKGVSLSNLEAEIKAHEAALGGTIKISRNVTLCDQKALAGGDPLERAGTLVIEVTAQLLRNRTTTTEKLRVQREFKTARVTPPGPFDRVAVFVARTSSKDLASCKGRSAFAPARENPRTLQELLMHEAPEGFAILPGGLKRMVQQAFGSLRNDAMLRRAHFVVKDRDQLTALLADRLADGGSLSGIVHVTGTDPVHLEFARFRGKCVLSFSGPVEVGEIKIEDPSKDSLTIVSSDRIAVVGRVVEASLINPEDVQGGIVFVQKTLVKGAVVLVRFPKAYGLSVQEWGSCQFQGAPAMTSGAGQPDQALLSCYTTAFAPFPVSVEHSRDGEPL